MTQMTNLPQRALQSVQHTTSSVLRPSQRVRRNSPFFKAGQVLPHRLQTRKKVSSWTLSSSGLNRKGLSPKFCHKQAHFCQNYNCIHAVALEQKKTNICWFVGMIKMLKRCRVWGSEGFSSNCALSHLFWWNVRQWPAGNIILYCCHLLVALWHYRFPQLIPVHRRLFQ